MRIIGGIYRHRLIDFPPDETTRPTKDRIRESLYSSLGDSVVDSNVLDLFAGSGAYGIEAISRGSAKCTFVDKDRKAYECINKNLRSLGITCGNVIQSDYQKFLDNYNGSPFDLVLLDPPYKLKVCNDIVNTLFEKKLISDNGIIVVETDEEFNIDESLFSKVKRFKYGFIYLCILRR